MKEEFEMIRVAKIAAIIYDHERGGYIALLDGGHKVPLKSAETVAYYKSICAANGSDNRFFARGG